MCLSSQLSGRADTSITHPSLSARCWRPSGFEGRCFALVSPAGRCLPSVSSPSPNVSKLALLFQTALCCRDLLRNSVPFSENRTDTRSADLGNPLSLLPRFSAVTRSCCSVPYVFVEGLQQCFHLLDLFHGCTCKSVRLRGERDNDRLWSAKYHLLCDLWVASGEFTISFALYWCYLLIFCLFLLKW